MDKETALSMVDGRIRGLQSTIHTYNQRAAEEAEIKAAKRKFASHGVLYPINEPVILRELARMEAARKDILSWKN